MGLISAIKRLAIVCPAAYSKRSGRCQAVLLAISLAGTLGMTATPRAVADQRPTISQFSSSSHHALEKRAGQSAADGASTLSGTLVDSLGNKLPGAHVEVDPAGGSGCGSPVIASTQTGADGSFSLSVSPGTYNILISFNASGTDPQFALCTGNVDLTASVNDTLTVPITQLTVIAQDAAGHPVQGATIEPGGTGTAAFDLFPGKPVTNGNMETSSATTGPAGTAVIPFIPLAQSITMSVQPPAGSGLAPTTVSTGLLTADTTVTATFAASVTLSGTLVDSLGNKLPGAHVEVDPAGGSGCGSPVIASTQTGADGSFSLSVSPGTYNILISFNASGTDPQFALCTGNVDLTASVNDTLTVPITQLTVIAQDAAGHPVQGATIEPGGTGTAAFDLFPGKPVTNGNMETSSATTGPAGTAVIPFIPLAQSITMSVQPPAGSGLAPTTVSTGLLTADTTVTATFAASVTLSGTLVDSLGNKLPGAHVEVDPAGGSGCGSPVIASTQTGADGSFSLSVSPGTYNILISFNASGTDPQFALCTGNVDLTASVNDTLTVPITQLTVIAQDAAGHPVQGATIEPGGTGTAAFDLFPGKPVTNGNMETSSATTGPAGTAVIPFIPLAQSITMSVQPPAGSGLAPTTVSTGLLTADTTVTATLAQNTEPPPPTGVTATPGNGSGIVSWTAPALQSGSVTGYTATALPGGESCATTGATTCTITGLTNGTTYIVTVIAYTTVGDSGPSAPVTVTPQAQKSASSTLITSITASPVVGQPITTTVRVAGESTGAGDPTPTGTVTVSDGTRSCQAPLSGNNGVATGSCQITEKSPGPYSFTASYPGDTDFTASHAAASVVAARAKSSTTMTLSAASVTYGNEKSLSITVTVAPQYTGTPTGAVIITTGSTRLCTVRLSSGTGTCSPRSDTVLSAGKAGLVAAYTGSADFLRSSAHTTLRVTKAKTQTTLTLSPASVAYGKERSLKLSVTVAPQYSGTPSGAVIVAVGQTTLCTIRLNGGTGSCSPSSQKALSRGKHLVVASYKGSIDFLQSSASKTVMVRKREWPQHRERLPGRPARN